MTATGRRVLAGGAWVYGAQVGTIVFQFAYAAITSRALDDAAFGSYAIALAINGLITLIATAGLGQTVGRMPRIDRASVGPLVSYALLLGVVGAAFALATAPLWVRLWGDPGALVPARWLAIGAFLAPLIGLANGLAQRRGRFRPLSMGTLGANVTGMAVGLSVVLAAPAASALVVFPLVAQALVLSWGLWLSRDVALALRSLRSGAADVGFSWRMTVANLLAYGAGNISRIGASQVFGGATLGQWNRADVVTSVPFQQFQTAMIAAVYPEFRHDREDPTRARRVWTDMLALAAWVALPASAAVAVAAPLAIPVLFGGGWELASRLAPWIALAAGIQLVGILLGSAVEALGRFRWVWGVNITLLALQLLAVAAMVITDAVMVVAYALLATAVLRHVLHLTLCARAGYVALSALLRQYAVAAVAAAATAAVVWIAALLASRGLDGQPVLLVASVGVLGSVAALAWSLRRRLPPVALAARYGIGRK